LGGSFRGGRVRMCGLASEVILVAVLGLLGEDIWVAVPLGVWVNIFGQQFRLWRVRIFRWQAEWSTEAGDSFCWWMGWATGWIGSERVLESPTAPIPSTNKSCHPPLWTTQPATGISSLATDETAAQIYSPTPPMEPLPKYLHPTTLTRPPKSPHSPTHTSSPCHP
jgi:hypothetical protein